MNYKNTHSDHHAKGAEGHIFCLRWMLGILAFLWLIGSMIS